MLLSAFAFPASAEGGVPLLNDSADIFDSSEELILQSELERIASEYSFDVAICTVENFSGEYEESADGIMRFADDYYDYFGLGQGVNHDGCVIVYNLSMQRCYISTCGYGITVFTDAGIQYIGQNMIDAGLYGGDDFSAFVKFIEMSEDFIIRANNGEPADPEIELTAEEKITGIFMFAGGGLVVAAIVATIVMSVMKGKHKSVRFQPKADEYIRRDSILIKNSHDMFLYSNVTRRAKPKQSSSGGSSTHRSSSGRTHGGGGF